MSCSEWRIKTFDEVCIKITDGSHKSPKSVEKGKLMASVKDMSSYGFVKEECRHISNDDFENLVSNGCKPKKNDVLLAKDGNTYLDSSFVVKEDEDIVVLSSIAILTPDTTQILPEYLNYFLTNKRNKRYIKDNFGSGSAIPRIVLRDIKKIPITVPSLSEQEKIVKVLMVIDNKIELNIETNKILEEMAQALFKRWFVDFEFPDEEGKPYKSNGGEMTENEIGVIPKQWVVKKIKDIGEVVAGGTPSTKIQEYYDGDISWITPKDLSGYDRKFISKGERSITRLGLEKSSAKLMKKGTVLFSSRAPIGYIAIAENQVTTNQGFKSIVCNEEIINNNYVYHYLKYNRERIENVASGSTFKEVSGATMKMLDIIVPPIKLLNKFNAIIDSYDEILKLNYIENDSLVEIRDSLLPKLMSGKISVEDLKASL